MQITDDLSYGVLTEPATLTLRRRLPGPIGRVWSYLTESDLRRKWLASGVMDLKPGAPFELTWHNDEVGDVTGTRPAGMPHEHHMKSRIVAVEPPRLLVFTWGDTGEVRIELETKGKDVLLTLVHQRVSPEWRLQVSAGWHMHLDLLVARTSGQATGSFWEGWERLKGEYAERYGRG
jgi:uncharacterized protein YndB with AHSA1/START domain